MYCTILSYVTIAYYFVLFIHTESPSPFPREGPRTPAKLFIPGFYPWNSIMAVSVFPNELGKDDRAIGKGYLQRFVMLNGISIAFLMNDLLILYGIRNGLSDSQLAILASFKHLTKPVLLVGLYASLQVLKVPESAAPSEAAAIPLSESFKLLKTRRKYQRLPGGWAAGSSSFVFSKLPVRQ